MNRSYTKAGLDAKMSNGESAIHLLAPFNDTFNPAPVRQGFGRSGYFDKLFIEIIQSIALLIPHHGIVILGITNHQLYQTLGTEYLQRIRRDP